MGNEEMLTDICGILNESARISDTAPKRLEKLNLRDIEVVHRRLASSCASLQYSMLVFVELKQVPLSRTELVQCSEHG